MIFSLNSAHTSGSLSCSCILRRCRESMAICFRRCVGSELRPLSKLIESPLVESLSVAGHSVFLLRSNFARQRCRTSALSRQLHQLLQGLLSLLWLEDLIHKKTGGGSLLATCQQRATYRKSPWLTKSCSAALSWLK